MKVETPKQSQRETLPTFSHKKLPQKEYFIENFQNHTEALARLFVCPVEKTLFYNKIAIDLSHQKKLFKIFYALFKKKTDGLDRDELIQIIYNPEGKEVSERQSRCYKHNIIKLLSRARLLASEYFEDDHLKVEWFPYSPKLKKWLLFRIDLDAFQNNLGSERHF